MSILKTLFRTAIIGTALSAAVLGGTAFFIGSDRAQSVFDRVTDGVRSEIDSRLDAHSDDPVVLRRRLVEVSAKYPEQIAQVRSDLRDIREEVLRIDHDREVCERVVELIDSDLVKLEPALAEAKQRADKKKARLASVPVTFDGEQMSLLRATTRAKEIARERDARVAAALDASQGLIHLRAQEQHFEETLNRLLDEQAELVAKVRQLGSEIESIARTDRLIDLLEKREATLQNVERFKIESLDGLTAVLERKRVQQEARLEAIGAGTTSKSYSDLAEAEFLLEETIRGTEGN